MKRWKWPINIEAEQQNAEDKAWAYLRENREEIDRRYHQWCRMAGLDPESAAAAAEYESEWGEPT